MTVTRHSALEERHKALGSPLGEWNGMDVPWEYRQDVNAEHKAVRTAAGLFDVSGLKKVRITGPDAQAVLNHVCTRDLTEIYPGRSVYAIILNEEGRITDDCIMFHLSPDEWMMVHGGGTGMEQLQKSASGKDIRYELDDDLHDISLQGPEAVAFLDRHTPTNLRQLEYFHHVQTTLFDRRCMISRTGYSGERGYEIFAAADNVVPIWDAILDNGKSSGIIPCSFNCIDMIRVEAALLFYPYDMHEEYTPWEVGLGFAVSRNKQADYRGRENVLAARGKEKIKTFGVIADADTAVDADAEVRLGGRKIGVVTAPMYSLLSGKSYAMVQLEPASAEPGIEVEIHGENLTCPAITAKIPFLDPKKEKRSVRD
jgi:aminomethyltransferase